MKSFIRKLILAGIPFVIIACASSTDHGQNIIQDDAVPGRYNFKFVGYNVGIDDPETDRRSYYKIYIDKVEAGRTTTGLESQEKNFEGALSSNRHLLVVEKWVLNQKEGRYVKLNNIEQPKPNYFYFNATDDKKIIVEMKTSSDGIAEFTIEYTRR